MKEVRSVAEWFESSTSHQIKRMSAGPHMLMEERVGLSSGEETVIVAESGHPVIPHFLNYCPHRLIGRMHL